MTGSGDRRSPTMSAERIPEIEDPTPDASTVDGLVREWYNGRLYAYHPIGRYIVSSPGVCGGRPIVKGTRIDARHIASCLRAGESPAEVVESFSGLVTLEAVEEAARLEGEFGEEFFEEPYLPLSVAR
jgi:uncharacterized protein (DUF433 family)